MIKSDCTPEECETCEFSEVCKMLEKGNMSYAIFADKSTAQILSNVLQELEQSKAKYYPRFHSLNEALGTIRAEYRELEDEIVKHAAPERIKAEALQVAAMCVKLIQYLETK